MTIDISACSALSNDLEAPALRLFPAIAEARRALEETSNVRVVRMSGSGATYFGLYETVADANAAADTIKSQHPDWWTVATRLGASPPDDVSSPD